MKDAGLFRILLITTLLFPLKTCSDRFAEGSGTKEIIENKWIPLRTIDEEGLMEERVDAWRNKRLWYMAESGYLIDGFEKRPGVHPWQGEHLGKWLHAATLAYRVTGDDKLRKEMESLVNRLLATQETNGYLGTNANGNTFMAIPEVIDPRDLCHNASGIDYHAV